jgi:hypothetical protein
LTNSLNKKVNKTLSDLDKGKFSKNKLKSGETSDLIDKLQVVEQTDGTFNVMYKGDIVGNYRN